MSLRLSTSLALRSAAQAHSQGGLGRCGHRRFQHAAARRWLLGPNAVGVRA